MSKEKIRELVSELEGNYGSLSLNRRTLENMNIEMGRLCEDVENTGTDLTSMGLRFNDMSHTIQLLADLLHYTLKEFDANLKETEEIKSMLFDLVVRKDESTKKAQSDATE